MISYTPPDATSVFQDFGVIIIIISIIIILAIIYLFFIITFIMHKEIVFLEAIFTILLSFLISNKIIGKV